MKIKPWSIRFMPIVTLLVLLGLGGPGNSEPVDVVVDGQGRLPILAGADPAPALELQGYIQALTGVELALEPARKGAAGIYVGRASDFPWLELEPELEALGEAAVLVRSAPDSLMLLGRKPTDVSRAVYWWLRQLGCRWFFPGESWEIVPSLASIRGDWNLEHAPSFYRESWLHYAHGSYKDSYQRLSQWHVRNMLLPERSPCGHSWMGLDNKKDYETNPEWFALVLKEYGKEELRPGHTVGPDGKRYYSRHHPCYSHPEVIQKAVDFIMKRADAAAAAGKSQVGASPPDWVDYCECPRCWSVFQGGEPFFEHLSWFAKRPDGKLVNATSETYFSMVNKLAATVAEKYPDMQFNTVAYSCYAHPPSFKMHPNVYVRVTAGYRRTPLSEEEQFLEWGHQANGIGVYTYSGTTYQFWDWPDGLSGRSVPAPAAGMEIDEKKGTAAATAASGSKRSSGTINLDWITRKLREWHRLGVRGYFGENAPSWASRGLGQYVNARLLWDVEADVVDILQDFYDKAFGPAAEVMERYYVRWYGPAAAVPRPEGEDRVFSFNAATLRDSARDLDEAIQLVKGQAEYVARLDDLRAYLYLLYLRHLGQQAMDAGEQDEADRLLAEELRWTGRMAKLDMVHSRALLGLARKGATWRNRKKSGTAEEKARVSQAAIKVGDPPTHAEIEAKWQELTANLY